MRMVGYVIVYDVSGSSYCEERECPLYEITTTFLLKHANAEGRAVRASRRIVSCGFAAKDLCNRLLPGNFEWLCPKCNKEPTYNRLCECCGEYKIPFILTTDCYARSAISDALAPRTFHTDASYGQLPFKEDLVAAAFHPERKNLWKHVLDIQEAKDLEAHWKDARFA